MSMNKAEILVDCITDKLGELNSEDEYLKASEWVNELARLADPQAIILRSTEKERDRLLILATKHCPKEHNDWQEILDISNEN